MMDRNAMETRYGISAIENDIDGISQENLQINQTSMQRKIAVTESSHACSGNTVQDTEEENDLGKHTPKKFLDAAGDQMSLRDIKENDVPEEVVLEGNSPYRNQYEITADKGSIRTNAEQTWKKFEDNAVSSTNIAPRNGEADRTEFKRNEVTQPFTVPINKTNCSEHACSDVVLIQDCEVENDLEGFNPDKKFFDANASDKMTLRVIKKNNGPEEDPTLEVVAESNSACRYNMAPRRVNSDHEDNSASFRDGSTEFKGYEDIESCPFLVNDTNSNESVNVNSKCSMLRYLTQRLIDFVYCVCCMSTKRKKSTEGNGSEDISKTISDLKRNLNDINEKVSLYVGPKSDTQFVHLKEELNKIHNNAFQLSQNNNNEDLMAEITMLLTRTEDILNNLNNRPNDENDNDMIRQIKEQIMAIHNDIEENPKTIDELNLCERILTGYVLSLDNLNTKDSPKVKGNYETTVRQVYATLKLLNEKAKTLTHLAESENGSTMDFSKNSVNTQTFGNECSNINITHEGKNMKHESKKLIGKDIKIMKDNVPERFPVRNVNISASNQCSYAIGIDLGTCFSRVTVFKNNKFEVLKNFQELRTIPSVVYIGPDKPSVGYEALKKGMADPTNLIHGVKRIMGRSNNEPEVQSFISSSLCKIKKTHGVGATICSSINRHFKPAEISAEILKEIKRIAEYNLKHPVNDVVVTIPAFFTEPQRRATLEACKLAGLNVLRLLNEPTAAALAYAYHFQNNGSQNVLVFDFGGGTCDISILEINGNNLYVKASFGNNYLGGLDFDHNILNYLLRKLKTEKGISINDHNKMRLLKECEKVKKLLSENETAKICLKQIHDGLDLEEEITRSTFENLNKEIFDKALETVKKCLENAGLIKNQIHEIVLAGGSSYIPKMQEMLRNYFKMETLQNRINPAEAISFGAALQAAIITGECETDFKLSDVTPHSVGIGLLNNEYGIIIRKNTNIPCKGTLRATTACGNQDRIRTYIFQGEDPVASYNTSLGTFTNILTPRKAKKTELLTSFEIDENGILTVTIVEIGKYHS